MEGLSKAAKLRAEILDRDAKRDLVDMLNQFSVGSFKFGNYTTGVVSLDLQIEKHRVFAKRIYMDVYIHNDSIPGLAKKHGLTVNQIKKIVAMSLMQQKAENALKKDKPRKDMKAVYEENKRVRELPKPLKQPVFSNMEWAKDEPV